MKRPAPSNETCLAAELMSAAIPKYRPRPYQAACLAADLCALGRQYKRLQERLCGGEEEWGRYPEAAGRIAIAERRRDNIRDKIERLLKAAPFRAHVEGDSLILSVVTMRDALHPGAEERTSLL